MGQRFTPIQNPFAKKNQGNQQRFAPTQNPFSNNVQSNQQTPNLVFTEGKGITNLPGVAALEKQKVLARSQADQLVKTSLSKDLLNKIRIKEQDLGKGIQDFSIQEIYDVADGDPDKLKSIYDSISSQIKITKEQQSIKAEDTKQTQKQRNLATIGSIVNKETGVPENPQDLDFIVLSKMFGGDMEAAKDFISGIQSDPNYKTLSSESAKTTALAAQGTMLASEFREKISNGESLIFPEVFNRDLDAVQKDLADVIARMRSGAAINSDEEKKFIKLLPTALDGEATRINKLMRLERQFKILGNTIATPARFNKILNESGFNSKKKDENAGMINQDFKNNNQSGLTPQKLESLIRQESWAPGFGDFTRSLASGATLGATENIPALQRYLSGKLSGENLSFRESKNLANQEFKPSLAGELTGAFLPGSAPSMIGKGAFNIFKVGKGLQATDAGAKIVARLGDIAKTTGASAISGGIIDSISQINDLAGEDFNFNRVIQTAVGSGLLGGSLSTAGNAIGVIGDMARFLKLKALDSAAYNNIVSAFRKQIARINKDSLSKEEVSQSFLNAIKNFSDSSQKKFLDSSSQFLTKSSATIRNFSKTIAEMLDEYGLIKKNTQGKFILKPADTKGTFSLAKTPAGEARVPVGNLTTEAQNLLNKEFQGVQSARTIQGLQQTKERIGSQIGTFIKGEDVALKRIYGAVKQDILDNVRKTHGDEAFSIVDKAYKIAEKDTKLLNSINTRFKNFDPKNPPELSQIYNSIYSVFKGNPSFTSKLKAVAGKDVFSKMATSIRNDVVNKAVLQEGAFRPNTFLIELKKFGFGTKNDVLKNSLSAQEYNQLKRLETLAKIAMTKYKINVVPLEGDALNFITTAEKAISPGSGNMKNKAYSFVIESIFNKLKGSIPTLNRIAKGAQGSEVVLKNLTRKAPAGVGVVTKNFFK